MLVLGRKVGERIIIGEDIELTVVGIRGGNRVRLGISAPADVSVHRQEVFARVRYDHELTKQRTPSTS